MRSFGLLVLVVVASGCRPTSLLELEVFVGADALRVSQAPVAVYVDFGAGQLGQALSLCDWTEGEFRRASVESVEFPPCPDTTTLSAAIAPLPAGASCNEGAVLLLSQPPEDQWFASTELDVFATEDCSIIETQTLTIGAD